MKKKIYIILTVFFLLTNNSFSSTGTGEVKLSNSVINGYIKYLMMNSIGTDAKNRPAEFKKGVPDFFAITKSGNNYGYSYCPRGQSCRFDPTLALQICRNQSSQKCYIFDRKRKIVWGNKNYKISRKATSSEIREILEELGFTGTKISKNSNKADYPNLINSLSQNHKADWDEYINYDHKYKAWVMAKRKDGDYSWGWQATNSSWTTAITKATDRCNKYLKEKPKKYPKHSICILYFKGSDATSDEDKIYQAKLYYDDYTANKYFETYPDILGNKKKKITKKKKVENKSSVVKQIQDLNEMYKSGIISKEEFDKAKKKILE